MKGVSLGYVGRNGNLKDLKQAFEEMLYRPPFLVFLAVSLFESVDLIWSARTTVLIRGNIFFFSLTSNKCTTQMF